MVKKIILGIFSAVLILLVAAYFLIRGIAIRGLPDYNGTVVLENLEHEVIVYRDSLAVPHIIADTEEDLYRATGYCMAQDRLWQMDLIRRTTEGRLSEILGKDMINADQLLRSLKIPEKSQLVLEQTDPIILAALNAFCDGVNQFITTHMDKLPPEFAILGYKPDPWVPVNSLNLIGYMAWDLTMPWKIEVTLDKISKKIDPELYLQLIPDMDFQPTVIYSSAVISQPASESLFLLAESVKLKELGLSVFDASNNWVVSGIKSVTGLPIFANDMHLEINAPGIWYPMHQIVKDRLNVTGVAIPGQPIVVAGHNDYIAWGMTNVMVDDMDFYDERLNPENPDEYLFNDEWIPLEIRKEMIFIKGGESVERINKFTHRGPIVSDFKKIHDRAVSMRWMGNEWSNELRTIYLLNRARNWNEFKEAARTFIAVSQNIAYADINGNIGIYCCAGVPIRENWNGIQIAPGWTDEFDWKGLVPFEDLPHSYNPPEGYVSSANNRPSDDKDAPHISTWFAPQYRIDRIRELLNEKDSLNIEDFVKMQSDQKSKLVEKFRDRIIQVLGNTELNDTERKVFEQLSDWNGVLDSESSSAMVFEKFYNVLMKNVFLDELGNDLYEDYVSVGYIPNNALDRLWQVEESRWFDDTNTKDIVESLSDIIIISYRETIQSLLDLLGTNPEVWAWGKLHKLAINHPLGSVTVLNKLFNLNRGPYPVGGSSHTVSPYAYSYNAPFISDYGTSHRHIYPVGDWDKSLSIIPTGISGIPKSRHYCDQTKLYLKNRYRNDYSSLELVRENALYTMVLQPNNE
jgi:penicillin amidase